MGSLVWYALAVMAIPDTVPAVQLGVRIQPDTVTVGLPFQVAIRVRAPRGTRFLFPDGPDTVPGEPATVQNLDVRIVTAFPDTAAAQALAVYRLAAWDVGVQRLRLPDLIVEEPAPARAPAGVAAATIRRTVSLANLAVVVRATTPKDSVRRIPRPARPYLVAGPPWWRRWLWLAALLAGGIGAWRCWVWWRRRRRPAAADPLQLAEDAFDGLDRLGLFEAGERGRYVALAAEVVREYLARRIPRASPDLTTTELTTALHDDGRIPMERLRAMLSATDLVKFARAIVSADEAHALAVSARTIVREVDLAAHAAEQPTVERAA